jgi:hypothetical protein
MEHRDDRRPVSFWRGRTAAQRWEAAVVLAVLLLLLLVVSAVR